MSSENTANAAGIINGLSITFRGWKWSDLRRMRLPKINSMHKSRVSGSFENRDYQQRAHCFCHLFLACKVIMYSSCEIKSVAQIPS